MDTATELECACHCGKKFIPAYENQVFFSRACSNRERQRRHRQRGRAQPRTPGGPPSKPPGYTTAPLPRIDAQAKQPVQSVEGTPRESAKGTAA